jgi:uncharacterized repeat protein (TIGR01451 family)
MNGVERQRIGVIVLFLAGIFFVFSGTALAQQAPRLELKTTVQKEVKVKRHGKWVTETAPADKTGPGDVLVYTIAYLNTGKTPAHEARIENPVPRGAVLIPESPGGVDADVTCSIDHGRTWYKPPVMIQGKDAAGKEVVQPAPADRYTHIRWVIKKPVLPGQSGRVSFKATVR